MSFAGWFHTPDELRRAAETLATAVQRLRGIVQRGTAPEPWAADVAPEVLELADAFRAFQQDIASDLLSSVLPTHGEQLAAFSRQHDALAARVIQARAAAGLEPLTLATNIIQPPTPLAEGGGLFLVGVAAGLGLAYYLANKKGR